MATPRILVVEDEQITAAVLQKQLQAFGYDVPETVSSGEAAIEKAEELRPDLVLMDIQLDGQMDGVEAAAHIRSHFHLPVVFITAYSNKQVLDRVKVTEPYGYILKPFEERELHVVVEMALYKHRMERALQESEKWLDAILKSIGDGVVATDKESRITFLNPEAERLTGWTNEEAKGRMLDEVVKLIHEETRMPVEALLQRAMREGVPLAIRTALVAKNRTCRQLENSATPVVDDAGRTVGGVMVFRDVTEPKQAEDRVCHRHGPGRHDEGPGPVR